MHFIVKSFLMNMVTEIISNATDGKINSKVFLQ